ncbi:hypothetical protein PybrP1_002982 [[Pythium] brassicae (nom. inval.)]|nr:hypothetical protein PybrP1_002982 [[Pythium] brassicae (nom. inval.)]
MFLLCVALLAYMRVKRHDAFKGDESAARKIILPAFEPLLWILAVATGAYMAFFCTTLATDFYKDFPSKRDTEFFYAGRQFVFVIVLVFMFQKSVSLPALRRAVLISLVLATYSVPIVWTLATFYDPSGPVVFWGQTVTRAALQAFYVYVYFRPPGRASRKSLRQFCVFEFVYLAFSMSSLITARLKLATVQATVGYCGAGGTSGYATNGYVAVSTPSTANSTSAMSSSTPAVLPTSMLKMTVTGTVDYMAPEMISGRAGLASYGEAADVYSLAITFWDILNPGRDRYPRQRCNPLLIFETVVDGTRPDLDIPMHPRLRELIANAWQSDPSLRPTAHHIVIQLEAIQEELLATFALDLCDDFDQTGLPQRPPSPAPEKYFTGEYAIEKMEDAKYVSTAAEAVRVGNALMDAGFLHHVSHEQGFDDTDAMYFFDEESVAYCQPFAILEAGLTDDSESSCSSSEMQLTSSLESFGRRKAGSGDSRDGGGGASSSSSSGGGSGGGTSGGTSGGGNGGTRGARGPKRLLSSFAASLTPLSTRTWSKTSIFSGSGSDRSDVYEARDGSGSSGSKGGGVGVDGKHQRAQPMLRKCPPIIEEDNTLERLLLERYDNDDAFNVHLDRD